MRCHARDRPNPGFNPQVRNIVLQIIVCAMSHETVVPRSFRKIERTKNRERIEELEKKIESLLRHSMSQVETQDLMIKALEDALGLKDAENDLLQRLQ